MRKTVGAIIIILLILTSLTGCMEKAGTDAMASNTGGETAAVDGK